MRNPSVIVVLLALLLVAPVAAQPGVLDAGTVTAKIDGTPFSAKVSIASFAEGKLVLTHLGNAVQIQVPGAKVGRFEIRRDADGGLVGVIVGLKAGKRHIGPVSGSLTIDSLSSTAASGRFEFQGKDLATDRDVKVSDGRFDVKFTGK